jgi:PAS domain S-box-containing protein
MEPVRRARSTPVTLVAVLGTGLAYFVTAEIGLLFALVDDQVTPLWPPIGIALAAIYAFGWRVLPGIALGAFAVNAPLGPSVGAAALIALGNTAAPALATLGLRAIHFDPLFRRGRDAGTLVVAATAAAVVSASVGSLMLATDTAASPSTFWTTWAVWWAGDAAGILVFTPPLLLMIFGRKPSLRFRPARIIEFTTLAAAIGGVAAWSFGANTSTRFLSFPILAMLSWRFEQTGAAIGALIASVAATIALASTDQFAGTLTERVVLSQLFSGATVLTGLILGSMTAERDRAVAVEEANALQLEMRVRERTRDLTRALEDLKESETRLEQAQQLARIGSWRWNIATDTVEWSTELYRITGLPIGTPVTLETYLSTVPLDERGMVAQTIGRATRDHRPYAFEHRCQRPDGTIIWVYCEGHVMAENGEAVMMFGICQDIEERKRADAALHRARDVEERRQRALELNDDIVQGLTVATYALESGDVEHARVAVEATLRSGRSIVGDLLGADNHKELAPGALLRATAAQVGRKTG